MSYIESCIPSNGFRVAHYRFMSAQANPPIRQFDQIHHDLEQVVGKLKDCRDQELRREMLLNLRLLLIEADAATARLDESITRLTLVPQPEG